ncbi:DENN domain-containing protein 11 [Fulvia fulva]|uniref:DENN domain-containing protein 11 n=1 Tax=Passalora fulva TaxID=5499 RepID=A0A9Q8LA62_PASFU|nr:DENN domain-containing protein 11 [Fulvia fulva]UJO13617.1 DENN domain-containing protein 11 [Fulvia fulva]WPV11065.1 DENN domain-containing protein 11 [Fulvia fulva]
MGPHDSPPVAAIFLVIFDQKIGYTTAWKRSLPDIDLDGVEYKSLPSGLHVVKEDLVYFIHGEAYAGISAFVQEEADATQRNANFAAVGALVPLTYGQLGRSWAHAGELQALAREVVKNTSDTRALELFWKQHRSDEAARGDSRPSSQPRSESSSAPEDKTRKRAPSEATLAGLSAGGALPVDHPASHVPAILDTFGPLLFPLHRAALARKRVLLLGTPSVQKHANIVYIASVLSSIAPALAESLPAEAETLLRASALFQVGIHDIDSLANRSNGKGWLACTTDDILGEKKQLYDVLVQLPSVAPHTQQKIWPTLKTSDGRYLKASQRDLGRWTLLKRELRRLQRQTVGFGTDQPIPDPATESDERPLLQRRGTSTALYENTGLEDRDESEAVEAASWGAMAYRGFMWWASAGEASAWENDDAKADEEILFDMPDVGGLFSDGTNGMPPDREGEYSRAAATMVVAYFRRVTEGIMQTMAAVVEQADDDTEEGVQADELQLSEDDMRMMGLDCWSQEDKTFTRDMLKLWFNRDAVVIDQGVRLCGVKIC